MAKEKTTKKQTKKEINITKLELMVTVVPREKGDFYLDYLYDRNISMQMIVNGKGTMKGVISKIFGIEYSEKAVIVSIVDQEKIKDIFEDLELSFKKTKIKGTSFTTPMSSVIGAYVYNLMCGNEKELMEKKNGRK